MITVELPSDYSYGRLTLSGIRSWFEDRHLYPVVFGFNGSPPDLNERLSSVWVSRKMFIDSESQLGIHTEFHFAEVHRPIALQFKLTFGGL